MFHHTCSRWPFLIFVLFGKFLFFFNGLNFILVQYLLFNLFKEMIIVKNSIGEHYNQIVSIMFNVEDILVCVFMLLFTASGLIVYIIVIQILLKKFSRKSYFVLASSLGIADCIFLSTTVLYVVPSTLTGKLLHVSHAFGGIINIAWFSALPLMLFLAGGRYLCMCLYKFHGKFYSLYKTKCYCLFAWLFGISYALPSFFNGCNILYDVKSRSWIWDIEENCAKVLSYGELIMVVLIAVLSFVFTALVLR